MNGYTLANYMDAPKGFDYTDVLVCQSSTQL